MTWQAQPNRNDVLTSAKNSGYSVNGYHTIPEEWVIEKSANATVTASHLGTEINAGTTAGDSVSIGTIQNYQADSVERFRTTWLFDTRHTPSPPADHLKVGTGMGSDPTTATGIFFDVTNMEINIRGDVRPINFSVADFDTFGVCVTFDYNTDDVAVEVRNKNQSQVERKNTTPSNSYFGVHLVSNGNGDNISLLTNTLTLSYDWSI